MTHKTTWQKSENRIAQLFGTKRESYSGGSERLTKSDTLHPRLYFEIKKWKYLPLKKLIEKTELQAKNENKTPVLIISPKGAKDIDSVIIVRLKDIKKISEEYQG